MQNGFIQEFHHGGGVAVTLEYYDLVVDLAEQGSGDVEGLLG